MIRQKNDTTTKVSHYFDQFYSPPTAASTKCPYAAATEPTTISKKVETTQILIHFELEGTFFLMNFIKPKPIYILVHVLLVKKSKETSCSKMGAPLKSSIEDRHSMFSTKIFSPRIKEGRKESNYCFIK